MQGTLPVRRVALTTARAWLDGLPLAATEEKAAVDIGICGRVVARDVASPQALPASDRVIVDGFAVRADDIQGAGDYNPIRLPLCSGDHAAAGGAVAVVSGQRPPPGFDTILPFDCAERGDGSIAVAAAVPRGNGIVRSGQAAGAGSPILASGTRVGPADVMLLREAGCAEVALRRRPKVALVSFGAKGGPDTSKATLARLIERDGGLALAGAEAGGDALPLARWEADLVLLAGRSGWGEDDVAEALVGQGARLDHHGLALRPCDSVGLGRIDGRPLLLLPGDPLSAWVAYELLAARLLRRWGALPSLLAYGGERRVLSRKIASPVGFADWVPLGEDADGRVAPVAIPAACPVAVLGRATAFALIPAESEGAAPGDGIIVHPLRT